MKILDVYNKHEQNRKDYFYGSIEDDIKADVDSFSKGRAIFKALAQNDDSDRLIEDFQDLPRKNLLLLDYFFNKIASDKVWVIEHILRDYRKHISSCE